MFKENDVVKVNNGSRGRPEKFTVVSDIDGVVLVKNKHGEEFTFNVDFVAPYPEKKPVSEILRGPDSE